MGLIQQLKLLLKKNVLFRKSHPGLLLLEVLWPVLIVVIVAVIRVAIPPDEKPTCLYQERAMPSAGLVPFVQTFVCNLDNKCHTQESRNFAEQTAARVSALVSDWSPYLASNDTLTALDAADEGARIISSFSNLLDQNLLTSLENATHVKGYFRDPEKMKEILVTEYNFSREAADALFKSQVNLTSILDLAQQPDLKGVACDPTRLSKFLIFPPDTRVTEVSRALCDLNDSAIPAITRMLQDHLDVRQIVRLLSLFESLKRRLGSPYTLEEGLMDVADMLDVVFRLGNVRSAFAHMAGMTRLPDVIRQLPRWIDMLSEVDTTVAGLEGFVLSMDPVIGYFLPDDPVWTAVKQGLEIASRVNDLINTRGNVTVDEVMSGVATFFSDTLPMLPPEVSAALSFFSRIDWHAMRDLFSSASANDMTVQDLDNVVMQIQQVMEDSHVWSGVSKYVVIATDIVAAANTITEQLLGVRDSLTELGRGDGYLKDVLISVLEKGPTVTMDILKAFTDPNKLALFLTDSENYPKLCSDVLATVASRFDTVTTQAVNDTLCHGSFSEQVRNLTSAYLHIGGIRDAVYRTVQDVGMLMLPSVIGSMLGPQGNLTAFYSELKQMINISKNIWDNLAATWTSLLGIQDTIENLVKTYGHDWVQVQQTLNKNFWATSILSLLKAADTTQNIAAMLEPFKNYVHIVGVVGQGIYNEIAALADTYSRDSPLGQLVNYATNYAPELAVAIMDLMKNNTKMEMIVQMGTSQDPLAAFCGEHMLQQMNLPSYMPLRDMEILVCFTNWTEIGLQLTSVETVMEKIIKEVDAAINNDLSTWTYNVEKDVQMVLDSVIGLVGLFMSSDDLGPPGPWSLLMYANFSQIGTAIQTVFKAASNLDVAEQSKRFAMLMNSVDRQFNTINDTAWIFTKHVAKIFTLYTEIILDFYGSYFEGVISLQDMMQQFPAEIQAMVQLAADAYLDFIDAFKNVLLKPDQFLRNLLNQNFKAPACGGPTVTSMLSLSTNSSFGRLETLVCNINWMGLSMEMTTTQPGQAFSQEMVTFITYKDNWSRLPDVTVNWTLMLDNSINILRMFAMVSSVVNTTSLGSSVAGFELWPFNMTAIRIKWSQFYQDMSKLQNTDYTSLMEVMEEIALVAQQEASGLLPDAGTFTQIMKTRVFISDELIKFINKQFMYMNSTETVNILDMLGSDELRQVAKVLQYSPEINAIGVNTLLRLISSGEDLVIPTTAQEFMALCTNLTFFKEVVAVDDTIIDSGLLQQTVCSLEVNYPALMNELMQNWNGFSELVNAIFLVLQPNASATLNIVEMMKEYSNFNQLLSSLLSHPPAFVIIPDEQWMNASLYAASWDRFRDELQMLFERFQNPNIPGDWQFWVNKILTIFDAIPDLRPAMNIADSVLTVQHRFFNTLRDPSPESFAGYPQLYMQISLLDKVPEIFETLAYTALQHQDQLSRWADAMVSWDTFCSFDTSALLTVPPGVSLNVTEVVEQLCSVNVTALLTELTLFEGFDRLQAVVGAGNSSTSVNVTAISGKLAELIQYLETVFTSPLDITASLHVFNTSVWEAVFTRLGQDFSGLQEKLRSPEFYKDLLTEVLPRLQSLGGEVNQALAFIEVLLDQMLQSLQAGSVTDLFRGYPTVLSAVKLLDSLPELYETVVYTSLFTPEKVALQSSAFSSFERFCATDLGSILTVPSGLELDLRKWKTELCSLNYTLLMKELATYQSAQQFEQIFAPNSSVSVNVTALSNKLLSVVHLITKGNSTVMETDARFLNTTAWDGVLSHLATWAHQAEAVWSTSSRYEELLNSGMLSVFMAVPEIKSAMHFVSLILDQFEGIFQGGLVPLPDALSKYPNIQKFVSLLEDAPEILEIFVYTWTRVKTDDMVIRWSSAAQSWDSFCHADPSTLLYTVPGSPLNASGVLARICSISIPQLLTEVNSFQSLDKISALISGNFSEDFNVTTFSRKLAEFVPSLETLIESPMESGYNLRIFNVSVWEALLMRLGADSNNFMDMFLSPEMIVDFFMKTFESSPELNKTAAVLKKILVVADVLVEQSLRTLEGGSLIDMFVRYPSLQSAVGLLDSLPEVYETAVYTALYYPDKVASHVEELASFETFCITDINTIFTVPTSVSFNFTAWQRKLCSMNATQLIEELSEYQGSQLLQDVWTTDEHISVNVTAVIKKIESFVSRMEGVLTGDVPVEMTARFLDASLWADAMTKSATWIGDPEQFWMTSKVWNSAVMELLLQSLLSLPNGHQIVAYVDAAFSLMDQGLRLSQVSVQEAFQGHPNLEKLLSMLDDVPEIFEAFAHTVLYHQEKVNKWASAMVSMEIFCRTDAHELLSVPPGSRVNIQNFFLTLCSLNLTELLVELGEFQGQNQLQELLINPNASRTVNVTVTANKLRDFVDMLTYLSNPSVDINLRIFNSSVWEAVIKRLDLGVNDSLTYYLSSAGTVLELLEQIFCSASKNQTETLLGEPANACSFGRALAYFEVFLDQMLKSLQLASPEDMFIGYPSVLKVFDLLDSLPDVSEAVVYTSLSSPQMIADVAQISSMEAFCSADLMTIFKVPQGSEMNISKWQAEFCSLNFTVLLEELTEYNGVKQYEQIFLESNNASLTNKTAIKAKLMELINRVTSLASGSSVIGLTEWRLLNTSVWTEATTRVTGWATNSSLLAMWMSPAFQINLFGELLKGFPVLSQQLGSLDPLARFSMVLMEKLLAYKNETSFSLDKIFLGAPDIQKLIILFEKPGVIEVLLESINTKQFEPIFAAGNLTRAFALLCDGPDSLSQCLTVPEGASMDLVALKADLCVIRPQLLEQQLMDFVGVGQFAQAVNGSEPVDWVEFSQTLNRIIALFSKWIENPPAFTLPAAWNNETFWLQMLESYSMTRQDPAQIAAEFEELTKTIASLLPQDPFRQIGLVVQSVLKIVNLNLAALQNQTFTFENIFQKIPAFQDVFSALGIQGDALRTLLSAPVNSTQLFLKLILGEGVDVLDSVCAAGKLEELLHLSATSGTAALRKAICLRNLTQILASLSERFDVQELINSLDSSDVFANLSTVFTYIAEVQHNIENLIKNPPSFNVSSLLAMIDNPNILTDMWRLAGDYSTLMGGLVSDVPQLQVVDSFLKTTAVILEFLKEFTSRLAIQGGSLDLLSAFSNSPTFRRMMDAVLQTQPDIITTFLTVSIRPLKVMDFVSLVQTPNALYQTFCLSRDYEPYLLVLKDANITELLTVFCSLNFTQLEMELSQNFMVDILTQKIQGAINGSQPLDIQAQVSAFTLLIERFANLSGISAVSFDGFDLTRLTSVNTTDLAQVWESYVTTFPEDVSFTNPDLIVSLINGLVNGTEKQHLAFAVKVVQLYLQSLSDVLDEMKNHPITIAALLNNTEVGNIVIPFLENPDSLEELFGLDLLPDELAAVLKENDTVAALCGPKLLAAFASPGNSSRVLHHLQQSVCSTNSTVMMWQTILGQARGYELYQQMSVLWNAIQSGSSNLSAGGLTAELQHLINTVVHLVLEYENGSRSVNTLLDWQAFQDVFNRLGTSFGQRLMNLASEWSGKLAELVWPSFGDTAVASMMGRTINTMNIFMQIINNQLNATLGDELSMSALLGHSQTLVNLMQAYLNVTQLSLQAWLQHGFSLERVVQVTSNMTLLENLCQSGSLATYLANSTIVSPVVSSLETTMCSFTSQLPEAFRQFIDYTGLQLQLTSVWNMSLPVVPRVQQYVDNIDIFAKLLQRLASSPPTVDPKLTNQFHFTSLLDAMQNVVENPQLLFRILSALGFAIDVPLRNQEFETMLWTINSYVALPMANLLDKLSEAGLTLSTVIQNPDRLLDAFPVLTDFSSLYILMKSSSLQPMLNRFAKYPAFLNGTFCNGSLPDSVFTSSGLDRSVTLRLCQVSTSQWVDELHKLGATDVQVYAFLVNVNRYFQQTGSNCVRTCYSDSNSSFCTEACSSGLADKADGGMGWMKLMNSLERLAVRFSNTNDSSLQSMQDPLSRIWTIMKGALLNNTVHTVLSTMEIADRTGMMSPDWLAFKQVLKFLNSAGNVLDTLLQSVTDKPGSVRLENLLPDSEKVASLLASIFGQTSAADILSSVVNPSLIYTLANSTQLQSIACDPAIFNKTFTFPNGTAVSAIQKSFCSAVVNHSTALKQLLDMFETGDILLQLEHLIAGDFSNMSADYSVWQDLYSTLQALVMGLENMQRGVVDSTVTTTWVYPLLQQLQTLFSSSNRVEMLCENYVSLVQGTTGFQQNRNILSMVVGLLEISGEVLDIIPVLDDIACAMATDEGLDIAAGVEVLKKAGLWDIFDQITQLMTNNSSFECGPLVLSGMDIYFSVNTLITTQRLNVTRLGSCIQRVGPLFADTLGAINQLYQVFIEMSSLITPEDLGVLVGNKEIGDIVDFVFSIISSQKSAVLRLEDLLVNSTDVRAYLSGLVQLTPDVIRSLLESTIHLNTSLFLLDSVEDIKETICNVSILATVLELPTFSPVSLSELSGLLCTADINITAMLLKDGAKSALAVMQIIGSLTASSLGKEVWIRNLTNSVVDLISELQGVSALFDMFGGDLNKEYLMKNADAIDSLLQSSSLQHIVNSLKSIIDGLQYFVTEDSKPILKDLQVFVDGIIGLELIQSYMINATRVSDLLKNAAAVKEWLMNDLGFSESVTNALLDSSYSIRVFLNTSSLIADDEPCAVRLQRFLVFSGTAEQKKELTDRFCNLNETELASFFQLLIPSFEIGDLLQKYMTSTGDVFLARINMTQDGVNSMLSKLNNGSKVLHEVAAHLLTNGTGSGNLNEVLNFPEADSQALVGFQPLLCGSSEDVGDSFGISMKVQSSSSGSSSINPVEEEQLNGDFCKQLYQKIRSSKYGSITWAYFKPIVLGKVLYTPDTPVTRQIIQETQWVFTLLGEVQRVAKIWSEKALILANFTDGSFDIPSVREALNNDFIKGVVSSAIGVNAESLGMGLGALESSDFNSTYLRRLQSVAEAVYNYTSCVDLDRFEGVATEAELENRAELLHKNNSFLGGIVFLNIPNTNSTNSRRKREANQGLPKHIMYKIRMDMDNIRTTKMLKDRIWVPKADDDFANDMRYLRGFMQLQDLVESAIIRLQTGIPRDNLTGVSVQQMPYPCHKQDMYLHLLGSYLLPVLITFAWLAALGIATHILVYDRQEGQEESLRVMGMVMFFNFLAWLFITLVLMAVVSVAVTLILKYSGIFYDSNWLILFLYFMAFCISSTAMCYLVGAFFTRVTLAILTMLIIYFLSFLPYIVLISMNVQMTQWQKVLACLSSTTAFSYGGYFITQLEEQGIGIQWSNVYSNLGDSLNFAWMCFMMLIDCGIYLLIGWYIRNVKPGKYGVAQPWYFPFSPKYWCGCFFSRQKTELLPPTIQDDVLYEDPPNCLGIGISVRGLRKTFGKAVVIPGLDVDIYREQVTTLLGHNGAAKTTTMNMLVGVLSPTAGQVLVDGKPVSGRTGVLGICPQYNSLFEFMTVMEHMEFYAGVKGRQSARERGEEIRKLLHDVDLWYMKDVPAKKLSGGMQRRLCVALAFVGGSETIVLDEPTSGVDPHARKDIWNLIIKNRPGRTILMSTHHLDEADMLSDRILVLHSGRLRCAGSPAFLKDRLGGGYKLSLSLLPSQQFQDETDEKASTSSSSSSMELTTQQAQLMTFIRARIPHAIAVEMVGSELTVRLPLSESDDETMYHFFRSMDEHGPQLGICNYGISNTTLEEVFLKITAESIGDISGTASSRASSADTESVSTSSEKSILRSSHLRIDPGVTGCGLKFQQLWALLLKRFHHYHRNWRMAITIVILPLLAFAAAMGFTILRPDDTSMPSLIMTPALYSPNNFAFFQDKSGVPMGDQFMKKLVEDAPSVGTTCMGDYDPGIPYKCVEPSGFQSSGKIEQSCTCRDHDYVCMPGYKEEDVMQMLSRSDIYLQNLTSKDLDQYLLSSFTNYLETRFGGWTADTAKNDIPAYRVWFNNKGYHAMPSFYNAFSNNLLRSFIPSNGSQYGITLFNHPLMLNMEQLSMNTLVGRAADIGIALVVLLALSFIPSGFMLYLVNERVNRERHLQSLSGVGTFLYWTASFLWDLFIYTIMMALMVAIVAIFKNEGYYARNNLGAFAFLVFMYGWAVIPLMYCTLRLFKSASAAYLVLFCCNLFIGLITVIILFVVNLLDYKEGMKATYSVLKYVFLIFPQFCLTNGLVDLVTNQMQYSLLARFGEDTYVDPFTTELLAWNFVALAIQGFVFLLLSYFVNSRKKPALSLTRRMTYPPKDDEDVYNEQERVRTQTTDDALVVQGLSKVYRRGLKKFCAVNHVSFGVGKGECFGLLGVNGAGKTTTFRMLTGDSPLSLGQVFVNGQNVKELGCLGEEIGYCPQEDALDRYLTGEETLFFHARLRGFSQEQAKQAVTDQLKNLRLESLAGKAVHTYSGGNKRKLSLAIALLGDPLVLLLDEPTTGMDAGTRRLAWKCITAATQRGQSVVLTSHSMDECDSLCSRLAIMVNGQLKCLGSPQRLKNKFGDGYTVVLHQHGTSPNQYNVTNVFLSHFPGSAIKVSQRLKDQHHTIVEIIIPQGVGTVADIFAALRAIKAISHVLYYSLTQTTLDTVFVGFAQEQTDDGEPDLNSDSGSMDSSSAGSVSEKDETFQKSFTGGTYAYMSPRYKGDRTDPWDNPFARPQHTTMAFDNSAYETEIISTKL